MEKFIFCAVLEVAAQKCPTEKWFSWKSFNETLTVESVSSEVNLQLY